MMLKHCFVASMFLACIALAAGESHAATYSSTHRVVVYRSGAAKSFALRADGQGAPTTDCDANNAALIFDEVSEHTTIAPDGATISGNVKVAVNLQCKRADLDSAVVNYEAKMNANSGFTVTPPQSVNLATATAAIIEFSVTGNTPKSEQVVSIDRTGGSYVGGTNAGGGGSGIYFGSIPSAADISSLTIEPNPFIDKPITSGGSQDGTQQQVYDYCTSNLNDPACKTLSGATDPAQQAAIVDALSPQAATAVASSVNQIASGQIGNVSMRLTDLAAGRGGGFSANGLNLVGGGASLSLADVAGVLKAAGDIGANEDKRTLLGGTRWGYWVNGSIGGGSRDRRPGNSGYDFNNYSVTGGIDYRFSDRFYAGGGVGFSRLDSDYGGREGSLVGKTWSLHGYGVYALPNELSVDGSVSWSHGGYDQDRSLAALQEGNARGSTDVGQLSTSVGLTWVRRFDAWTFSPQGQYQFIRSDVDGFAEHGCVALDPRYNHCLIYPDQHLVTRSLSLGAYLDRTIAAEAGTFRPYARLLFYSDGGTGAYDLASKFVGDPGMSSISVRVDEPDRHYGTLELGLGFSHPIGTRTVDFNFGAMDLFGQDNFSQWALRADMRVPF